MSLATIRAALFAHITASGPWLAREVSSCTFDILESTSASCLTFFPEGATEIEPLTFGTQAVPGADKRNWRIGGTLWIQDLGDPLDLLNRIWLGYDDLYNTFHKTRDLGGTAENVQLVSIAQRTDNFRAAGGHVWKPIDWVVVAEEF